jgi:hypothetical protein
MLYDNAISRVDNTNMLSCQSVALVFYDCNQSDEEGRFSCVEAGMLTRISWIEDRFR